MATTTTTAAVGIDIGSYNARVATFDESLGQAMCAHNSDGHRTTKVSTENDEAVAADTLMSFVQAKLVPLATDAAHTKNLHIVASVPNDNSNHNQEQWIGELLKCCHGGVISEAAAICLAYGLEVSVQPNQCVLVIDGGFTAIKATKLRCLPGDLWTVETTQSLASVNGMSLVEPLAQSVAQQFETKHRFPRGEVWQSKKARAKLQKACESGLTTLQINNTLTIHVDGLYEGMDCQVTISKAKWDHLSSTLVKDTKEFLKKHFVVEANEESVIEKVLLSGNMHTWLKPIVTGIFADKVLSSDIDPSEAIALGCAKQAKWSLENNTTQQQGSAASKQPCLTVPVSPITVAINRDTVVIEHGTPLPVIALYEPTNVMTLDIWQIHPSEKKLATFEDVSSEATIRLFLSKTGQLKVAVDGECFDI
ncbi:Hsp70 domain containing protein [Nitzschia inconspicua]|uniref:Hsp70 domain containing protein n=1 Tax=Nitzschia inconspicua TaxID=303405 RepID=A0A9K3KK90_9STRA|nr:Hsp70 domain containing protein [Nitzschia inconspicua]